MPQRTTGLTWTPHPTRGEPSSSSVVTRERLKRTGFISSVFMGLPHSVDTSDTSTILAYMNTDFDEEDERFRFFTEREFSVIFSQRGQVGSSFVYTSCSMALSLLWFATAVLSRPCCLESII
ncbi:unnamed protein product, partial [Ectocarpus sp. 13 AM-2016]